MEKTKKKTSKAKDAKEEIKEKKLDVQEPVVDESIKHQNTDYLSNAESIISEKPIDNTKEEKKSLKSTENESKDFIDYKDLPEPDSGLINGKEEFITISDEVYKLDPKNHRAIRIYDEELEYYNNLLEDIKNGTNKIGFISFPNKEEEVARKAHDEYLALTVIAYNMGRGASFKKTKKKITISDLLENKNIPDDASRTSQFVMSNHYIFDLEQGVLTNLQETNI